MAFARHVHFSFIVSSSKKTYTFLVLVDDLIIIVGSMHAVVAHSQIFPPLQVKYEDMDFDWGVVINFTKKPNQKVKILDVYLVQDFPECILYW